MPDHSHQAMRHFGARLSELDLMPSPDRLAGERNDLSCELQSAGYQAAVLGDCLASLWSRPRCVTATHPG